MMLRPPAAAAQEFPSKSIRFISATAPGGAVDFVARAVGQKLTEKWGQQIVIDNRAGGGGVIGVQLAAGAAPDGYTILVASSSQFSVGAALTPDLPYDVINDFAPISLMAMIPNFLMVHPSLQANSVRELIQLAKTQPGKIAYGSAGVATTSHIAGELLSHSAGIKLLHVPYKGTSGSVFGLVGGEVQLVFGSLSTALPLLKTGKLRVMGVATPMRVAGAPDVPTFAESGLPGFEVAQWFGLVAPKKTPPAIVAKLNAEVVRIVALPEIKERLSEQGFEAAGSTPAELASRIRTEIAKWSALFKEVGLRGNAAR
ncbi:MAG: tripartite tricarboxylate transporter substrate binding protein [Betaproteobacteria bacterium]|nr:tripartite tricarboxylate transporter substrate binding protein [Betaproteobacteria bacterium]